MEPPDNLGIFGFSNQDKVIRESGEVCIINGDFAWRYRIAELCRESGNGRSILGKWGSDVHTSPLAKAWHQPE
jgi:hypothetical protein